jgi:MerR family transcriptional regulator, mercuric resistance operon regulatory protein
MEQMTIGQLASAAGVNVETVRYYQRRGLLSVPKRSTGSIARYSAETLTRLRFIRRSQSLGFSLDDVQALLSLEAPQACSQARRIGEHKLAEVRERIASLQALERTLAELVCLCSKRPRRVRCPMIGQLMDE